MPVKRWRLSDAGIVRARAFAASLDADPPAAVWASSETKAIEAAGLVAARFGLPVRVDADLDENDRSATGYLPPDDFERMADAFFARPDESVAGWERAVDAQARGAAAVARIMAASPAGGILVMAHGGIGTLVWCHLAGLAIDRRHDQPFQGHYWAFDGRPLHGWRPMPDG